MAKRKSINGNLVVFLLAFLFCGHASAETKPVGFAIPFPDLTFTQTLSKNERAYLGILQKKGFSLREIRGNLILTEFISTYCASCQRQAPIFNELYSSIEKDRVVTL
jgi:thiol-disulfide isomerase/thioredoxin